MNNRKSPVAAAAALTLSTTGITVANAAEATPVHHYLLFLLQHQEGCRPEEGC